MPYIATKNIDGMKIERGMVFHWGMRSSRHVASVEHRRILGNKSGRCSVLTFADGGTQIVYSGFESKVSILGQYESEGGDPRLLEKLVKDGWSIREAPPLGSAGDGK